MLLITICLKYTLMELQATALAVWRLLFHIACPQMLDLLRLLEKQILLDVFGTNNMS